MKKKLKTMIYPPLILGMLFLLFAGCKSDDNGTNPTQGLPVLTTTPASSITGTGAVSGGNITSDGGSTITERGICWSKNQNPSIADSKSTNGSGIGSFTANITGLTAHTTYYIRAYATNSAGTSYGNNLGFVAWSPETYFGHSVPGQTPVLFAPDILNSLSIWAGGTALSPDGTQFFASVGTADYSGSKLYSSKLVNNVWTPFELAPFTADFNMAAEPVFSGDGKTLMFTGKKSASASTDFWTVNYSNNAWDVPVALPSPINSNYEEYRGSYMTNGTFYFGSTRSGAMQIYRSLPQSQTVELVAAPINTGFYDCDPCVAPDGSFIIFSSGRAGGYGKLDLYVSFSNGQGGWGTPINLGSGYNSTSDEYGVYLSSDGKYLFFTRHNNLGEFIYWVSVSAIENFRR